MSPYDEVSTTGCRFGAKREKINNSICDKDRGLILSLSYVKIDVVSILTNFDGVLNTEISSKWRFLTKNAKKWRFLDTNNFTPFFAESVRPNQIS